MSIAFMLWLGKRSRNDGFQALVGEAMEECSNVIPGSKTEITQTSPSPNLSTYSSSSPP